MSPPSLAQGKQVLELLSRATNVQVQRLIESWHIVVLILKQPRLLGVDMVELRAVLEDRSLWDSMQGHVTRCAELLDRWDQDWFQRVPLDTLDMRHIRKDMLYFIGDSGRAYLANALGRPRHRMPYGLASEDEVSLGLKASERDTERLGGYPNGHKLLALLWKQAITARQRRRT